MLDLAQDTDDRLGFRTHIFPEEYPPTFYVDVTDDETEKIELSRPSSTQLSTTQNRESHNFKRKLETAELYKRMRSKCIKRNLKLSDCAKRKLSKHSPALRKFADKRVSSSAKKRLINQRGCFLVPLLAPVLPSVSNLLFRQRAK